jgi:KDO2-lipid IV(A) lauroyltransferase
MTGSAPTKPAAASEKITLLQRVEALFIGTIIACLSRVPATAVPRIGAGLGWVLYNVFRFARKQVMRNLQIAFGDLPESERKAIARRCYLFFGSNFCEALAVRGLTPQQRLERVTFANPEVMDAALAQGKGVLLFVAHFGSWEALGPAIVTAGYPFTVFTGGMKNPLVDEQINSLRRSSGLDTVPRSPTGARGLLRALKAGRISGLVADQHESTKRHYVSFFGQPVSVAPGPYQLAKHTGAPVVFGTTVRIAPLRYRATFEFLPPPDPSAEAELDLLEFTQRAFALLERDVRAYPDHYFWMHRRFRPIPREVSLTPVNRKFLESRLSGPVDAFWEDAAQS